MPDDAATTPPAALPPSLAAATPVARAAAEAAAEAAAVAAREAATEAAGAAAEAVAQQQAEPANARLVAILVVALLTVGCLLVVRPFLSALVWAAIIAFSTWPAYRWLRERTGMGPGWAALVMVAVMYLLIGVPLLVAAPTDREQIDRLRGSVEALATQGMPGLADTLGSVPLVGGFLRERWEGLGLDFSGLFAMVQPYVGTAAGLAFSAVVSILSGVAELLLAIAFAFFFYRDGPRIGRGLERLSVKLGGRRGRRMLDLTGAVTIAVIYGLLGTAVVQGVMTGIGFWIAGIPGPVLWGVVAGLISILPVGAPLVWIPATIWLFAQGQTGWGVFMGLYGAFGISSVDNFIRPWLLAKGADQPLLLTILGALGGAISFGLLGLFLGPVLLAVGFALARDWATDGRASRAVSDA